MMVTRSGPAPTMQHQKLDLSDYNVTWSQAVLLEIYKIPLSAAFCSLRLYAW
jgi:hypothetical protein